MSSECYPITLLPHISRLYADFLASGERPQAWKAWYGKELAADAWDGTTSEVAVAHAGELAALLERQNLGFGAGPAALENIGLLGNGARAVVTGQQVGLLGGPLLTLLKASTAIARARQATVRTGHKHVPIFWLASEDHDLVEVNQVTFAGRKSLETLRLPVRGHGGEVGMLPLGPGVEPLLDQASEFLDYAPICDLLRECYRPETTFAEAFGSLMARLFAAQGLVMIDASGRDFHRLGAPALRGAITQAAELEENLLARTASLEAAGYHAQVLVKPGGSLLFLLDQETGARVPLRRAGNTWKAAGASYTTEDLLEILEETPERLSPNALLRPVFQDTLLPTAAYIGGPAEIAYFAQSEVIYRMVLGRMTPVLPRFSATLIEPAMATVMARHELSWKDLVESGSAEALMLRLGARAMPIEGKRRIAAAGNAMDTELTALTSYLDSVDASLGRSAVVSANKMRYQMNRLRRMAATFELQKEASLTKHAHVLLRNLYPDGHPQERVLAGIGFIARSGEGLVERLVREAGSICVGHTLVRL
jgi:bacillithiol biosynthesis cysteine-adding enzyme BshC